MHIKKTQGIESNVLIIGGGLAGLMAALEATKITSGVTLVCKKKAGLSGNTLVSGAGLASFLFNTHDSQDLYFHDTVKGGKYINDSQLVKILANQSEAALMDLEALGVNYIRINNQLLRKLNPGHSTSRTVYCTSDPREYLIRGISLLRPLMEQVKKSRIRIIENTPVVRLEKKGTTVFGAWGLNINHEELVWFPAKSIVLAAGGGARLFAENNNTSEMTGDAYNLALTVGAVLRDMEFIQFYPTMLQRPVKMPLTTSLFADGAVLCDQNGNRFMTKYAPIEQEMATRDKMAQAIFLEIRSGDSNETEIFVDCTQVPKEKLETNYRFLYDFLVQRNIDMLKEWLPVRPTTHFFMGGVKIDQYSQTNLKGLFAAGECTGGVHGANRLATNALTEATVFGKIAGKSAAQFALNYDYYQIEPPEFPIPIVEKGKLAAEEVKNLLHETMWKNASIIRSHNTLSQALTDIKKCRSILYSAALNNLRDLSIHLEIEGMCLTAETIVRSALFRKESRGSHFREDMPQEDDHWLGSVETRLQNSKIEQSFVPSELSKSEKSFLSQTQSINQLSSR
ncbi:MAG: FAD-dependent oxidoreductase [Dehalobacterium sp.]